MESIRGSPPQVRGKLTAIPLSARSMRITPAGAGKTHAGWGDNLLDKDHPRRCGENVIAICTQSVDMGSPPQVRGKPVTKQLWPRRVGITPAGAGKTGFASPSCRILKDHPRRCGENSTRNRRCFVSLGSPPQVRGKLSCGISGGSGAGITPAGAGKTLRLCLPW